MEVFFYNAPMTPENVIRESLEKECLQRGKRADIAKTFDVSQSTVKRWVEGSEIPPPLLKLLDWYLFGTVPPRLSGDKELRYVLEFEEDEWAIICASAHREGTIPGKWIAGRIRSYLAYTDAADLTGSNRQQSTAADEAADEPGKPTLAALKSPPQESISGARQA